MAILTWILRLDRTPLDAFSMIDDDKEVKTRKLPYRNEAERSCPGWKLLINGGILFTKIKKSHPGEY